MDWYRELGGSPFCFRHIHQVSVLNPDGLVTNGLVLLPVGTAVSWFRKATWSASRSAQDILRPSTGRVASLHLTIPSDDWYRRVVLNQEQELLVKVLLDTEVVIYPFVEPTLG